MRQVRIIGHKQPKVTDVQIKTESKLLKLIILLNCVRQLIMKNIFVMFLFLQQNVIQLFFSQATQTRSFVGNGYTKYKGKKEDILACFGENQYILTITNLMEFYEIKKFFSFYQLIVFIKWMFFESNAFSGRAFIKLSYAFLTYCFSDRVGCDNL